MKKKLFKFLKAVWTVINEGHNQVRLHNHNNFLAIVNGQTIVIHVVSIYMYVLSFLQLSISFKKKYVIAIKPRKAH